MSSGVGEQGWGGPVLRMHEVAGTDSSIWAAKGSLPLRWASEGRGGSSQRGGMKEEAGVAGLPLGPGLLHRQATPQQVSLVQTQKERIVGPWTPFWGTDCVLTR